MADLESIIAGAVAEAGGGEGIESPDVVDTGSDTDTDADTSADTETPADDATPDPTDTSTNNKPVVEADTSTEESDPKIEDKPAEKDDLTKELEALGLKEPKEGERENRLPFRRVKKITENYGKKVAAKYEAELTPLKTEVEGLRKVKETVSNVDRLIATDPDRYITMLAGIHPEYKKFLAGGKVETPQPAENKAITQLGPKPAPDHKFEDGSMGYTPEQHDKLLEWTAAKAKEEALAQARAELDQRFKPFDDERKSREAYASRVKSVQAEAQSIREAYGADIVAKYEDKIVAHMKANPTMSARQAAREIIVPALQADRNAMRTELLKEVNERPKAAARTPSAASAGKKDTEDGPRSLEDVIRDAVAAIK